MLTSVPKTYRRYSMGKTGTANTDMGSQLLPREVVRGTVGVTQTITEAEAVLGKPAGDTDTDFWIHVRVNSSGDITNYGPFTIPVDDTVVSLTSIVGNTLTVGGQIWSSISGGSNGEYLNISIETLSRG